MTYSKRNNTFENPNQTLNDIEKCHITFLYKLHFFNQDLHNKINGNDKSVKSKEETLYIINRKLIEVMKSFYFYDEIKPLFTKERKINDIIASFPSVLINKIKNQNHDVLKDEKLFNIKILKVADLELYYYTNISLSDDNTISYLKPDKFIYNKMNKKISSGIAKKKLFLTYENLIYIGIIDYNNIFIPEILLFCSDKNSLTIISKEIKSNSIENFKNQIEIGRSIDGFNIGKYKGPNVIVLLDGNNNINKSIMENKNSQNSNVMKPNLMIDGSHQKNEISQNYQKNYNNIGEFQNTEINFKTLNNEVSHNNIQNASIYQNWNFLNDSKSPENQQYIQQNYNNPFNNNSQSINLL